MRVTEILSEKMSALAGAGGMPRSRISGWAEGAKGGTEHGREEEANEGFKDNDNFVTLSDIICYESTTKACTLHPNVQVKNQTY